MFEALLALPRFQKKLIAQMSDVGLLVFSLIASVSLRYGELYLPASFDVWAAIIVTISLTVIIGNRLNMYSAVIRYLGHKNIISIVLVTVLSAAILASYLFFSSVKLPRSVPFIYGILSTTLLLGSRFALRMYLQYYSTARLGEPVIIFGAGSAGFQLASALAQDDQYTPVAFVDDNPKLHGRSVLGITVHSPKELKDLIEEFSVKRLLFAICNIEPRERKTIIDSLEEYPVKVKTIPGYSQIISGEESIENLRDLDIEDLLGRPSVKPSPELLGKCVTDLTVMVTGAGGSIGSEICRQIIELSPKSLVLIETSEYALYSIEQELKRLTVAKDLEIVTLIGSIQNKELLSQIFSTYRIDTVYHAAAYKHVPMVEQNIVEAAKNNVLGTLELATMALKHKVGHFVLISTDKAVRPTNIMGATKRCAELVLQAFAKKTNDTIYSIVRFGNVLGSSGSVVPLFKSQIENDGPVTVTHPDITRFFMTIPEAAQLVIQAGAMGDGGDVFVLDMGEPVKIVDLAKKMVHLMGKSLKDESGPEEGIEIVYTGLRPGEKLYEELLIGGDVTGTFHPRIMRAKESSLKFDELMNLMNDINSKVESRDAQGIQKLLIEAPTDFVPSSDLSDAIWLKANSRKGHIDPLH